MAIPTHKQPPLLCLVMAIALVLLGTFTYAEAEEVIDDSTPAGIVELLVSDRADEVARGESKLAAQRDSLSAGLLEQIQTGDAVTRGKAAYELGLMISPWMRGKESGARFYEFTSFPAPRRPVDKVPKRAESAAIRQSIQSALSTLLESAAAKPVPAYQMRNSLGALCETLGEVADDNTMDWAIHQLQSIRSPVQAEPLLTMATSYLGVPPGFRSGGICGNSTAAEFAAFLRSQEAAVVEARTALATIWEQVRPMDGKDRIAFAIKNWREYFVPRQQSYSGHYFHEGWLFQEMESLVRLGTPAVDQLRAQQAIETEPETKGVWEAVIAAITGREDTQLVRSLIEGSNIQRELACEIIAGTGSRSWLHELDELQSRSGFEQGKASKAIAVCHREEGIPALKRGFAANSYNFAADCAIKELEMRAERGSPRHIRRYHFQ